MAAWWGANVTPGWSLMTWGERNEHRQAMRTLKTHEECNVFLEKHHERMMERAKEHGKEPLPPIQHNACERLKP